MASFPPVTMTTEGLNMITKASSGSSQDRLIITKVKLGDGVSEGNIRDYTDVISSKKEVTLAEWEDRGDGRFRYTFIYNNEGVKTGFYHREIGLFAKNGDSGTEKLIAYSNAGSYPGYIDDETKEIPYQRLMINIGVGDTDNVSGQVDASNAVTIEMLNEHDADENAHDNLIKRLFGSATATMESVKTSVQSWCKESIASLLGISSATTDNIKSKIKSWAQEQIEIWLETLGIRYNIAQNGYICLGKLFGGLILQWGMFVTNVEQGKNNTFTFPIAFKNNLYFYWAFDYTGYFYNLIIKNKDINSCYIYGAYPNGTEQTGELAPTGVSGISVFIGS
ncbi:hypothetical protein [Megamonas funiformis]|uniref:gp53-like domain-containing protein n=1 Tax=Megamonas funiformis TaxID=437897 RepID=UPI0022E19D09|nr:hypothetical protein [Megamonas funiformis]